MRRDPIELPSLPRDDRPGDPWMDAADVGGSASNRRVRTWAGRRRHFIVIALGVFGLAVMLMIILVPAEHLIKPGELSTPHAQILAGTMTQDKCAACHDEAALSPLSWFRSGESSHDGVRQSDLCMNCHHRTIPANLSHAAHNLPLSVREQLTENIRTASLDTDHNQTFALHRWIPDAAVDQNNVQCATCHKEHQGFDGDLLSMSDAQCQSCHVNRFGSFADSHPDWSAWPYGRGGQIQFNHATHMRKHFPGWNSGRLTFDCAMCHPDSGEQVGQTHEWSGEVLRVASYENSCQACHDESMNLQAGKGIEFVTLPMLPTAVADRVGNWPERATGFADGVIPPLTELLLRADPAVANRLRRIPNGDISRITVENGTADDNLVQIATQTRSLMQDFGRQGQAVIEARLLQIGISVKPFQKVLRSLSPQLVDSANEKWFAAVSSSLQDAVQVTRSPFRLVAADEEDLLGGSLLLSDDDSGGLLDGDLLTMPSGDALLTEEPLLEDPLLEPAEDAPDQAATSFELVRRGGWYRDDDQLAIRYRGQGHADPVLVGLIETFAQLSEADPLKQRFFSDPKITACVSCHESATSLPARWTAQRQIGRRSEFTKFSHRPHLNVSALGDCLHCHQVAEVNDAESTRMDFEPLGRQSCAACHQAHAAGETCTTCHRYHIGP